MLATLAKDTTHYMCTFIYIYSKESVTIINMKEICNLCMVCSLTFNVIPDLSIDGPNIKKLNLCNAKHITVSEKTSTSSLKNIIDLTLDNQNCVIAKLSIPNLKQILFHDGYEYYLSWRNPDFLPNILKISNLTKLTYTGLIDIPPEYYPNIISLKICIILIMFFYKLK